MLFCVNPSLQIRYVRMRSPRKEFSIRLREFFYLTPFRRDPEMFSGLYELISPLAKYLFPQKQMALTL